MLRRTLNATMKVLVLLLATVTLALSREIPSQELSAFGYFTKYGIPEAERIRKLEEENANNRIVGGVESEVDRLPYQAALLIELIDFNGIGLCGASLISLNRLLTAAHCWYDGRRQAWRFTVVLGSTKLYTGGTRIQTTQVVVHDEWNPNLIRNDIAVIYLPSPVQLSASIGLIALPSGSDLHNTYEGITAVASGFGLKVSGGDIEPDQYLSHVNLKVIKNSVCRYAFFSIVQDSNICTSGIGRIGTCSGDSGGPLVAKGSNGEPIVIGVTSFGFGLSCSANFPAAFARVTSFIDFIKANL